MSENGSGLYRIRGGVYTYYIQAGFAVGSDSRMYVLRILYKNW